jgi:hypothetical protein|tara:strand:+ start:1567 stop:1797 length:231 start_codon:yes stop_codon:yes gene_type:complete
MRVEMDYVEIIFVLGALLFFGTDLLMMALTLKDLKDGKVKASWSSMGVVRKGLVVGLIVVMVVFIYWLATDSILAA